MTLAVLEDAARDLELGRLFYDSCKQGAGDYFLECLLSDLHSLLSSAGVHRKHFGFHRMLSKRFPFGIYYETEAEIVRVYGILDMRRDPSWIHSQLKHRTG